MCSKNVRPYDAAYFDAHTERALSSARIIVPILLKLIQPRSVLDIGCGRGAWLRAFIEHGLPRVRGMDGPHVDVGKLLIPFNTFQAVDLSMPFGVTEDYDLAICLEVVEHLPRRAGLRVVDALAKAAPVVLFSAAIPGQGGTGHLNERWPAYWKTCFERRGFRRLDPVRHQVWQKSDVDWPYRQNMFLFASAAAIENTELLRAEAERSVSGLELVHPDILASLTSLRGILRQLPKAAGLTVMRRLRRFSKEPSNS